LTRGASESGPDHGDGLMANAPREVKWNA
jgi:hypothetical protein